MGIRRATRRQSAHAALPWREYQRASLGSKPHQREVYIGTLVCVLMHNIFIYLFLLARPYRGCPRWIACCLGHIVGFLLFLHGTCMFENRICCVEIDTHSIIPLVCHVGKVYLV